MADAIAVSEDGRITPNDAGLWNDTQAADLTSVVAAARERGTTRLGITLSHAGRRGATRSRADGIDRPLRTGAWPLLAPSPIPYTTHAQTPRAMTDDDMDRIRDAFVSAARRADSLSIDLITLDMSRGYLLGSFLSPLTNQRDDAYGGCPENRRRFPLSVLEAVRAAWSGEKPLAVALSASDRARGGNRLADTVEVAKALKVHGCDLILIYTGQTIPDDRPTSDFATFAHAADVIRTEAAIPTLATGYATTSNHVNTLLAGGRADLSLFWQRERE
jgi:anthraniloyl-CoA monooxygenase